MIFDRIEHAGCYLGIHPRLDVALCILSAIEPSELKPGRHVIQEGDVTCSRFTAQTHPREEGLFEAHRRFFDIHVPLSGTELLLFAPTEQLTPSGVFDPGTDCQRFHCGQATELFLAPGMFAVCFPGDGHMPLVGEGAPHCVEKLIFKVRI